MKFDLDGDPRPNPDRRSARSDSFSLSPSALILLSNGIIGSFHFEEHMMKYTRQGVSLEYDDLGNGTALLFIHGFPLDRSMWGPQVNALQKVCRVIAPDLRGFGQSSDTDGQAVTMETYAEDMKALLDSLNVKQVVVCGLSMGGYIALAFIAKYADRVKGLILSNTKA